MSEIAVPSTEAFQRTRILGTNRSTARAGLEFSSEQVRTNEHEVWVELRRELLKLHDVARDVLPDGRMRTSTSLCSRGSLSAVLLPGHVRSCSVHTCAHSCATQP